MTAIRIVKITLKDYGVWRDLFDGNKEKQTEFGLHIRNVYQSKEDPNTVFTVTEIDDIERAQEFTKQTQESGLRDKAGVIIGESTVCIDVT
mgnify:CR=1 FL=1